MFTKDDVRHYGPLPEVGTWLGNVIQPGWKVLEIGPGIRPFPRADVYVDLIDIKGVDPDKLIKVDVANEPLPFADKAFDFVVCRHTLEDLFNPFLLCAEMSRVAKSGYVETPSPLAELTKGVDGGGPEYRGFHHHRYVVWRSEKELAFVAKYPLVELMKMTDDGDRLEKLLRKGPLFWNTYYPWEDRIIVKHHQCPQDFAFCDTEKVPHYFTLLNRAIIESIGANRELLAHAPRTGQ